MGKKQSTKSKLSAQKKKDGSKPPTTPTTVAAAAAAAAAAAPSQQIDDNTFPPELLPKKRLLNAQKTTSCEVTTLCPSAVFVAPNFLTPSECDAWIEYAEHSIGFEYVSHPATKFVAHRECHRIQRTDWTMAEMLFRRMGPILERIVPQMGITSATTATSSSSSGRGDGEAVDDYKPVGCNGNIRLYKYERGMSFGKHVDGSNPIDRFANGNTEITVLVYLSSCQGGGTRFYLPHSTGGGGGGGGGGKRKNNAKKKSSSTKRPQQIVQEKGGIAFVPQAGSILFHVHGDRCLEHEADPVEGGVKYVLRTDIVYGTVVGDDGNRK